MWPCGTERFSLSLWALPRLNSCLVSPELQGSKSIVETSHSYGKLGCVEALSEVRNKLCSTSLHNLSLQSLFRTEPLIAVRFNENSSRKNRVLLSLGCKCSWGISSTYILTKKIPTLLHNATPSPKIKNLCNSLPWICTVRNNEKCFLLRYTLCMGQGKCTDTVSIHEIKLFS